MKIKKILNLENIRHEFYYVLLVGLIPSLLTYAFGGTDALYELMNSATPPFILLFYLTLIFGLHLVISLELNKKSESWWTNHTNSKRLKITKFISNLAQSVIGIYRLITGIAFAIPFLSYFVTTDEIGIIGLLAMVSIGISFFMGTCLISFIYKWTETIPNKFIG